MTFRTYGVYLLLFLLVISSWFMAGFFQGKEIKAVKVVEHSADYFSTGYYKKEMNIQGLVKNELNADKMIHYSDDQTTHLENPLMTLYNPELPPWVIKSETGLLEPDGDHLLLAGEVFISREGTEKRQPFEINTSELRVTLSISYAETDQWAEIIAVPNRTQGVGLQATFVDPVRLKFLSKVKGRYEIN